MVQVLFFVPWKTPGSCNVTKHEVEVYRIILPRFSSPISAAQIGNFWYEVRSPDTLRAFCKKQLGKGDCLYSNEGHFSHEYFERFQKIDFEGFMSHYTVHPRDRKSSIGSN